MVCVCVCVGKEGALAQFLIGMLGGGVQSMTRIGLIMVLESSQSGFYSANIEAKNIKFYLYAPSYQ